jgi:hypothetical protein
MALSSQSGVWSAQWGESRTFFELVKRMALGQRFFGKDVERSSFDFVF